MVDQGQKTTTSKIKTPSLVIHDQGKSYRALSQHFIRHTHCSHDRPTVTCLHAYTLNFKLRKYMQSVWLTVNLGHVWAVETIASSKTRLSS